MVKVEHMGVFWEVYPPLSQIYLEGSREDLYDFLDENVVRAILRKAREKEYENYS